jgi:hypothetical protein
MIMSITELKIEVDYRLAFYSLYGYYPEVLGHEEIGWYIFLRGYTVGPFSGSSLRSMTRQLIDMKEQEGLKKENPWLT